MIVMQLFSLITFPILTRILTKEQYAIMGLITTTLFFGVAIAKAGLSDGIIRFYKEYSNNKERLAIFSSTVLVRGIVLTAMTGLLYIIGFLMFKKYVGINQHYAACFLVMTFALLIRPLNTIVLYLLRVNDKTIFMIVLGLVERTLSIGLSLLLFLYVFHEFYGYFIGLVLAEFVAFVILFYWFFKHYEVEIRNISRGLNIKLLKFGLPMLLSELTFLSMSYADRYIIVAYLGESNLGIYTVGYNLAMYIGNIIMFSLSYAVVPIYVEIFGKEGRRKTEEFLQKALHYLVMMIIPMWFGYLAISKDLFIGLASEKYTAAANLSPLILAGYFLLGLNVLLNAGLYLEKKTIVSFGISFSAVLFNICLNFLLLTRLNLMGAAISSFASSLLATVLTFLISSKYLTLKIEMKTLVYYVSVSCFMFIILRQIEMPGIWMNLGVKVMLGILITAVAILWMEKEIRDKIMSKKYLKSGWSMR